MKATYISALVFAFSTTARPNPEVGDTTGRACRRCDDCENPFLAPPANPTRPGVLPNSDMHARQVAAEPTLADEGFDDADALTFSHDANFAALPVNVEPDFWEVKEPPSTKAGRNPNLEFEFLHCDKGYKSVVTRRSPLLRQPLGSLTYLLAPSLTRKYPAPKKLASQAAATILPERSLAVANSTWTYGARRA